MIKNGKLLQFGSVLFLGITILWLLIQKEVLYTPDGPIYALRGKELAMKPFFQWATITWNGGAMFDHPHLLFWLIGIFVKLFGAKAISALLPNLILGTLCMPVVYWIGRELWDHHYGILSAIALVLTPIFVKICRNPMIEETLSFFIFLAILLGLLGLKRGSWKWTVAAGVSFGFALLAKGPPAFLSIGVLGLVWLFGNQNPLWKKKFVQSPAAQFLQLGVMLLIGLSMVIGVDLWHQVLTGESFFGHYLGNQLKPAFDSHDPSNVDRGYFFFIRGFFTAYWPWMPFALLAPFVALWKRDRDAFFALIVGMGSVVGCIGAFSILPKKLDWYTHIQVPGFALMVGVTWKLLLKKHWLERYQTRACMTLATGVLFLCAIFPSIFEYNRDGELFLMEAGAVAGKRTEGQNVEVCIPLNHWNGPALVTYFLGATWKECNERSRFKIVRSRDAVLSQGYIDRYSGYTFSLLELDVH